MQEVKNTRHYVLKCSTQFLFISKNGRKATTSKMKNDHIYYVIANWRNIRYTLKNLHFQVILMILENVIWQVKKQYINTLYIVYDMYTWYVCWIYVKNFVKAFASINSQHGIDGILWYNNLPKMEKSIQVNRKEKKNYKYVCFPREWFLTSVF